MSQTRVKQFMNSSQTPNLFSCNKALWDDTYHFKMKSFYTLHLAITLSLIIMSSERIVERFWYLRKHSTVQKEYKIYTHADLLTIITWELNKIKDLQLYSVTFAEQNYVKIVVISYLSLRPSSISSLWFKWACNDWPVTVWPWFNTSKQCVCL